MRTTRRSLWRFFSTRSYIRIHEVGYLLRSVVAPAAVIRNGTSRSVQLTVPYCRLLSFVATPLLPLPVAAAPASAVAVTTRLPLERTRGRLRSWPPQYAPRCRRRRLLRVAATPSPFLSPRGCFDVCRPDPVTNKLMLPPLVPVVA